MVFISSCLLFFLISRNCSIGLGKVTLTDLEAGLSLCTHLVYGYAGINAETKKVVSLNPSQDLDQGKGLYRLTTQLKRKYPGLKVLLGVGGDAEKLPEKYMECLETSPSRISFINSVYELIKSYEFDGLDLAFEFPKIKPKKIRSSAGKIECPLEYEQIMLNIN